MAAEKTATQYSSFHMSIDRPVRFRFGFGKWQILPIAVRSVIFRRANSFGVGSGMVSGESGAP